MSIRDDELTFNPVGKFLFLIDMVNTQNRLQIEQFFAENYIKRNPTFRLSAGIVTAVVDEHTVSKTQTEPMFVSLESYFEDYEGWMIFTCLEYNSVGYHTVSVHKLPFTSAITEIVKQFVRHSWGAGSTDSVEDVRVKFCPGNDRVTIFRFL